MYLDFNGFGGGIHTENQSTNSLAPVPTVQQNLETTTGIRANLLNDGNGLAEQSKIEMKIHFLCIDEFVYAVNWP